MTDGVYFCRLREFALPACRWVLFRNEVLKHPGGKDVLVSGRPDNHDIVWINQQIQDLLSVRPLVSSYQMHPTSVPAVHTLFAVGMLYANKAAVLFGVMLDYPLEVLQHV